MGRLVEQELNAGFALTKTAAAGVVFYWGFPEKTKCIGCLRLRLISCHSILVRESIHFFSFALNHHHAAVRAASTVLAALIRPASSVM